MRRPTRPMFDHEVTDLLDTDGAICTFTTRCFEPAVKRISWNYFREGRPAHYTKVACEHHARLFAIKYGLDRMPVYVDFDGVLCAATVEPWQGPDHFGKPIPGAQQFLERLSRMARVVVFSTRLNPDEHFNQPHTAAALAEKLNNWFERNGFPRQELCLQRGKPRGVYVDDYAVCCRPSDGHSYARTLYGVRRLLKEEQDAKVEG